MSRVDVFWECVPRPMAEGILQALFAAYMAAEDACDTVFEGPEKENIVPFYRRGLFEQDLRRVARQFPDYATAKPVRDDSGFWHHTCMIMGRIALTQQAAGGPEVKLRSSQYKQRYASDENQLFLPFDEGPPEEPAIYSVLTHRRSSTHPNLPGFAIIRFPRPNLDGFHPGRIDLFAEFPDVVAAKFGNVTQEETIEDTAVPELLDEEQAI